MIEHFFNHILGISKLVKKRDEQIAIVQARLDAQNALLDEPLKQQFPERSLDDIRKEFPEDYLGLVVTRFTARKLIETGRLFAHSPNWVEFQILARQVRRLFPQVQLLEIGPDDPRLHDMIQV